MNKTIYEEGLEKGKRSSIERVLRRHFGKLSESVQQRVAEYPAEKLDDLLESAVDAPSLKEIGLED